MVIQCTPLLYNYVHAAFFLVCYTIGSLSTRHTHGGQSGTVIDDKLNCQSCILCNSSVCSLPERGVVAEVRWGSSYSELGISYWINTR